MRTHEIVGSALALALVARTAAADINSETFRPTPSVTPDALHLEPADVGDSGEWTVSTFAGYSRNPVTIYTMSQGAYLTAEEPVKMRTLLQIGGAYAFARRFEAAIVVPTFVQSGESNVSSSLHAPAASGPALGDVGMNLRVRVVRAPKLSVAAAAHLTLPTATDGQFVGHDGLTGRLRAIVALRATPKITLTANAGPLLRAVSTYSNANTVAGGTLEIGQGSGLAWGAGIALHASAQLRVTGEAFGEVLGRDEQDDMSSPIDALLGLRYDLDSGLSVGAALGRGVTSTLGTPEMRGVIALSFTPSRAVSRPDTENSEEVEPGGHAARPVDPSALKAIAADSRDRCPTQAEDVDGFEDSDGCPDPDNDADAIVDAKDKCPDKPETLNGIDDNDGCPDEGGTANVVVGSLTPEQAAEQTFKQGRELMRQKQYAKACAAFEHSQRLDPQFGTQFNLAGCYIEIGKLATAWTVYRELSRVDQNLDRRAQSADAATKLAKRVPKLHLSSVTSPTGMTVYMNGSDATALVGLETPVDFGTYEIVAGAPGHSQWRKTVTVSEEGKVIKLRIQLDKVGK